MKRTIAGLILLPFILGACQGLDVTEPAANNASIESSETSTALPVNPSQTESPDSTVTQSTEIPSKTPRPPSLTPTLTPDSLTPIVTPALEGWQPASETSGLIPNRRWLIFHRDDNGQLGGFNVDGTGLTWFDLPSVEERFEFGIWREWIAYTTRNRGMDSYDLVVARFPDGQLRAQIPLHNPETDLYDISYLGNVDWSADGELMVVSAARDGDDTDIYIFRKFGDYLERITTEAGEVHEPRWSPDGNLIIYKEFVDAGCGVYIINTHEFNPETEENVIVDTDNLSTGGCGRGERPIYAEAFDSTGKYKATICIAVFCLPEYEGLGVYIQGPEDEEPRLIYRVTEYPWSGASLRWDKTAQRFIVDLDIVWLIFNREGSIEYEVKDLQISPDETMVALVDQYDVLAVYQLDNGLQELWRVADPPIVTKLLWIPNSNKILVQAWTHIYHLDVDKQTVNLVGRDLALGFSIYDGYWVSQNP